MTKYKFRVPIPPKLEELKSLVEKEAEKIVQKTSGKAFKKMIIDDSDRRAVYSVKVIFYLGEHRWKKEFNRPIPREDWGLDLDNLIKQVFDGLGPIIGYRKNWSNKKEHAGAWDSAIVEVYAKKEKTEGPEYVEIEVEKLYDAVRR